MSLQSQITTDLNDVFFNTDDFGSSATWTPAGGSATTIKGIFYDNYNVVESFNFKVESKKPAFRCATASVSTAAQNDTFTHNSINYTIIAVEPVDNDPAETWLKLQKA